MSFIRDSTSMLLARGIAVALGMVTAIVLARWLGPEDRGSLAIFMLTVSLVVICIQAGIPEALIYVIGSELYPPKDVLSTVFLFALGLVTISSAIAQFVLIWYFGFDIELSIVLVIAAGSSMLITFLRHILIANQQFAHYGRSVCIEGVLYLCGIVVVWFFTELTIKWALAAWSFSLVITLGILVRGLFHHHNLKLKALLFKGEIIRACMRYSFHLFITSLSGFGVQRISYFLLEMLSGLRVVGLYTAANTLPNLFSNLPQQMATVLYTYTSSSDSPRQSEHLTILVFQNLVLFCICLIIPLIFFVNPIVLLLFGPEYKEIGRSVVILSFAMSFSGLSGVLLNALAGKGMPKYGSYLTLMNLSIISILAFLFIPWWGLEGAAWAYFVTTLIGLLFMVLIFIRISQLAIREFYSFSDLIKIQKSLIGQISKLGRQVIINAKTR